MHILKIFLQHQPSSQVSKKETFKTISKFFGTFTSGASKYHYHRPASNLLTNQHYRLGSSNAFHKHKLEQNNEPEGSVPIKIKELVKLQAHDFVSRHVGPSNAEVESMLAVVGYKNLDELINKTIPESIRLKSSLKLPDPCSEHELIELLEQIASNNTSASEWKSFIGMGYYGTVTPAVILRNMFENVAWTTAYTAYQPEISQGRLESLINFQTLVCDLTKLPIANASLLDEATAAAEAMQVCIRYHSGVGGTKPLRNKFLVSKHCHPQTIAVLQTRALGLGIELEYFDETQEKSVRLWMNDKQKLSEFAGCLIQYPNTRGSFSNLKQIAKACNSSDVLVVCASDLLALTLFKPPGDFKERISMCIGSSQRLGIPINFGGPSAAFMACEERLVRMIPGRIVGLTKDSNDKPAFRFALQTREQHIRRERATSNICTSQALLANMSAMYAVYHGAEGLKEIASAIHSKTNLLATLVAQATSEIRLCNDENFFDTLVFECENLEVLKQLKEYAKQHKVNLRYFDIKNSVTSLPRDELRVGVSLDETVKIEDVFKLAKILTLNNDLPEQNDKLRVLPLPLRDNLKFLKRETNYLEQGPFQKCKSESQLVRYMRHLELKDISLADSMIPLGSCTMKLNGTTELLASSWKNFANCHPFAPAYQCKGYATLIEDLNEYLCEVTGFKQICFQPNSGAQGEYAGLRVIKAYLDSKERQAEQRDVCLIPVSAHGTNPASARMAGMRVVTIKVRQETGDIDMQDLREKIEQNANKLACLMVTYPSTFGVFEESIRQVCDLVHEAGGQVYLDGANMNAQVGLCRPADFGADVSHLNLHKTFCIPHGGGGPGVGPIGVKAHLVPFLPSHPLVQQTLQSTYNATQSFGSVSAAMFGSPAILPISWSYIKLMGARGLKYATEVAILNANYMRKRLENDYKILYRGASGNVAHEFILDCRMFKKSANIEAIDISKRLQDFSLHSATVSWPVTNTLMLEPTESEDKQQLDNYCDALLQIRNEISQIEIGKLDKLDNPLRNAPHSQASICATNWTHAYSREQAAFPASFVTPTTKIWPSVGRVNDSYGDQNLFCTCVTSISDDE